jgi:hypothetical protein
MGLCCRWRKKVVRRTRVELTSRGFWDAGLVGNPQVAKRFIGSSVTFAECLTEESERTVRAYFFKRLLRVGYHHRTTDLSDSSIAAFGREQTSLMLAAFDPLGKFAWFAEQTFNALLDRAPSSQARREPAASEATLLGLPDDADVGQLCAKHVAITTSGRSSHSINFKLHPVLQSLRERQYAEFSHHVNVPVYQYRLDQLIFRSLGTA